ncbi:carboxypeptidase-like regulatory domain-containing protein [Hymenobacter aerilatus]|uniref:Carboxypeptidase-like regulatory domain-containing protein n=1 Tax=Hymenobacter aerilatus TaxID=2932251 RepID=A0A8T9T1J3_9BACT|nr:carboxypeptidase-like regulatory domain-containing protein [Hymenobacter aerilatus]UOR07044.1 carboxypeptidase-like regulatory domain-containing protein [Hymenobacter aerilatus]
MVAYLLFFPFSSLFLQAPTPSITNAATHAAVPYASVGVKGKPIGTVADAQGHFDPQHLAAAAPSDTVVFSCVGYQPFKLLAADLPRHSAIKLTPQAQTLGEVHVRANSWKRHRLGRDGSWGFTYYNFHLATDKSPANIPGREVGTILHIKPGSYLEDAHVYFGSRNYKNLRFRLNVRTLDADDHPATSLLTQDVQMTIPDDAPAGWQHIDLKPYQVCVGDNKRIAVTLEWLDGLETRDRADKNQWNVLLIPAALSATHRMVFREKSEDQWQVQPINLSLYVTVASPRG